tara:strand:- start:2823 stop:3167 length:345 start_codon:yes stop_codon:yes gene_type:complete
VRVIGQALFAGGELIQTHAQRSITEGAVSGKGHVPSLPGEPPNADTHHLANNIETTQPRPDLVEVRSNAEYAAALEFGTSRMAERPYMVPARNKKRREVTELVIEAVNHLAKRG